MAIHTRLMTLFVFVAITIFASVAWAEEVAPKPDTVISITIKDKSGSSYPDTYVQLLRQNDYSPVSVATTDKNGTTLFKGKIDSGKYFICAELGKKYIHDDSLAESLAEKVIYISDVFDVNAQQANAFNLLPDLTKKINIIQLSSVEIKYIFLRSDDAPFYFVRTHIGGDDSKYMVYILPMKRHYSIYGSDSDAIIQNAYTWCKFYANSGLTISL